MTLAFDISSKLLSASVFPVTAYIGYIGNVFVFPYSVVSVFPFVFFCFAFHSSVCLLHLTLGVYTHFVWSLCYFTDWSLQSTSCKFATVREMLQ